MKIATADKLSDVFRDELPRHVLVKKPSPVTLNPTLIKCLEGTNFIPDPPKAFGHHLKRDLYSGKAIPVTLFVHTDGSCPVRGVLASLISAARAYAEGWPVLYIADAGILDTQKQAESAMKVVEIFLAQNKDILTAKELETLVEEYNGNYDISIDVISVIFGTLLKEHERKVPDKSKNHGGHTKYYGWIG
ncbi:hypothetical protein BGZ65_007476 [Modicella reniformis]|uniref:Uncharacterized protein n=1 Tax=Modicella reniformis TaxID=1440133 RepID=A0A9P6IKA0_9FUNG|nr:hypothetical protein BGZ65_007476 [Modicella reniformis]